MRCEFELWCGSIAVYLRLGTEWVMSQLVTVTTQLTLTIRHAGSYKCWTALKMHFGRFCREKRLLFCIACHGCYMKKMDVRAITSWTVYFYNRRGRKLKHTTDLRVYLLFINIFTRFNANNKSWRYRFHIRQWRCFVPNRLLVRLFYLRKKVVFVLPSVPIELHLMIQYKIRCYTQTHTVHLEIITKLLQVETVKLA